jgi:hypothetical protein
MAPEFSDFCLWPLPNKARSLENPCTRRPYVTSQKNSSLYIELLIFEGVTLVTIKITVFWNVISCTMIEAYRRFGGTSYHFLLSQILTLRGGGKSSIMWGGGCFTILFCLTSCSVLFSLASILPLNYALKDHCFLIPFGSLLPTPLHWFSQNNYLSFLPGLANRPSQEFQIYFILLLTVIGPLRAITRANSPPISLSLSSTFRLLFYPED